MHKDPIIKLAVAKANEIEARYKLEQILFSQEAENARTENKR